MNRLFILVYEGCLIVLSALLGRWISDHFRIIPTAIIHFPAITVTPEDFRTVLVAFVVIIFAVLLLGALIFGRGVFTDARRTAIEIYSLLFGLTLSSIYLFLFTEIVFSPELMASTGLSAFALFALSFIVGRTFFARGRGTNPLSAIFGLLGSLLRLVVSPAGIAVLLFALSPVIIAKAFTTSRDFANFVTRVRMMSSTPATLKYQLTSVFPGVVFLQPIDIQFPPDQSPFIYVLERRGQVWRMGTDGGNRELLLDFSSRVGIPEVENGALGFALHPEFGRDGSPNKSFVYAYYTDATVPNQQTNRLVRFDLSLPTVEARTASETPLIEFNRNPDGFHNAGDLEFGPDNFLYFSIGEAEDRANHQRIDMNPVGGIFRIDVDMKGGSVSHPIPRQPKDGKSANYFIPNDNPFVGVPNALEEYWALGLRNPFRFSFDRESGTLWVGDVGSDEWEEVNLVEKGGNYQYPYIEGESPQKGEVKPDPLIGIEHGPVYFYHHTANDRSVGGGVIYRGDKLPELRGLYVFVDIYSGRVLSFPGEARKVDKVDFLARSVQVAQRGVVKIVNAPTGDLYMVVLGAGSEPSGEITKLVKWGSAPPQTTPTTTPGAAVAVDGREIFSNNCARCHGPRGDGNGPDVKEAGIKMPDFTAADYPSKRSEAQVVSIIRKGGEASGLNAAMPPWDSLLSEAEIEAAARYVRGLSQKQ